MEPWLLFFDIDGTLLDNDTNQVPDSTIKALKKRRLPDTRFFCAPAGARSIYTKAGGRDWVLTAW